MKILKRTFLFFLIIALLIPVASVCTLAVKAPTSDSTDELLASEF